MADDSPLNDLDPADLRRPSNEVAEFVEQLAAGVYGHAKDRRSEPRFSVTTIVDVQQLDADLVPHGEPYQIVTRNISANGIGFLDTRPIETKYAALRFTSPGGEQMTLMVEVLRCAPYGGAYDIGGRFVTDSQSSTGESQQ